MVNAVTSLNLSPRPIRPAPKALGLYFRAGRNDASVLLDLLAAGETRFYGVVVDPTYARFQKELVQRARARRLDVILDPRTQPSATIGGFNDSLGELPWGRSRPHTEEDFRGASGRRISISLARFAAEHGYTQVLTASHLLRSTADEWLDIDRRSTLELSAELERTGARDASILYSLAITYAMLRDPAERRVLIRSLKGLPIEGIWLSVDGVGSHSTPAAVRAYLDAVSDFHALGLPVVADHVGGVVGLGLLAFGVVGGLAHGITYGERFDTAAWRMPRVPESFGLSRRVYIPALDMLLKPKEAEMLFAFGSRAKALFGCHESTCCRRGVSDMQAYPAQHFMRQRIEEIEPRPTGSSSQSIR